MKLDITSLYFNGDTRTKGNTPSWGTALGQERPHYPISVEGAQQLLNLIHENHIDFDPIGNSRHKANIKQLSEKRIISSGCFDIVYVNNIKFEGPFYLLVVEETSGSHVGRKSLKYNNKIEIDGKSNQQFYKRIEDFYGEGACWFAYDISAISNELHISVVKVNDKTVEYDDAAERKKLWESLINDYDQIKEFFKSYLLDVHKIKHESTANEYLRSMPKIQQWFLENGLCQNNYRIWDVKNDNSKIDIQLKTKYKDIWFNLNKIERGWYGTPWNRWLEFVDWYSLNEKDSAGVSQLLKDFKTLSEIANFNFKELLIYRFVASLQTKPFVILTGLSGSGKTKLAQTFSMWISASKDQYVIVPVGADWTNREPLLGYPNSLNVKHYVKPDSGVLDIVLRAHENYTANNKVVSNCIPYFLILDEMNLSHVERYFADFLSTMESGDKIKLYSGDNRYSDFDIHNNPIEASLIPQEIVLPKNLFIIGTVNIDETTYMFSPKVLDRANTIEFRISEAEMQSYFTNHSKLDMNQLLEDVNTNRGKGSGSAVEFMKLAAKEGIAVNKKDHLETFIKFFTELQKAGAEFGYRTANEITELIAYLIHFELEVNDAYDIAIIQKLLPKLHGSRSKLNKVIPPLLKLCENEGEVIYPMSHEKLTRMKKNADENGFASFAEA